MDWTLTGALVGVALLATAVGYEFVVVARSDPEPAKEYRATTVLIPGRDRPVVNANVVSNASIAAYPSALQSSAPAPQAYAPAPQLHSPALQAYAPALQGNATQPSNAGGYPQYPSRVDTPSSFSSRPNENLAAPDYGSFAHNQTKSAPQQPQIGTDTWKVQRTAKATYFNLGGHVDQNGVVDSLASGYLREALKKHRNYPKLPAQIKGYIDEPTIDLTKIADYHALLGMDEQRMEEEQGVKFIRIASSRSIEDDEPTMAEIDAPPLDFGFLRQINLDVRREMTLGSVP